MFAVVVTTLLRRLMEAAAGGRRDFGGKAARTHVHRRKAQAVSRDPEQSSTLLQMSHGMRVECRQRYVYVSGGMA